MWIWLDRFPGVLKVPTGFFTQHMIRYCKRKNSRRKHSVFKNNLEAMGAKKKKVILFFPSSKFF